MKEKIYVYNIGFTVNGVEDETQFDTLFCDFNYAVVDLINCFLKFIKENEFENVEIKYIDLVGIEGVLCKWSNQANY